ncbi:MAG TPA: hypothetical protein VLA43_16575, partial [Longimicrobiales bacterium]|nr:hypothetical protein [Longimicrobiales bacterium]
MFRRFRAVSSGAALLAVAACAPSDDTMPADSSLQALVNQYAPVRLTADISHLSEGDQQVVRLL